MKKRILSLLLVVMLLIAAVAGCSNGAENQTPANNEPSDSEGNTGEPVVSEQPKTLRFIVHTEPEVLDPGLAADSSPSVFLINTFEGLTSLNEKDNPVPGVAKEWEISEDGLEYVFHLRENAKWSDGQDVTAEDYSYAWKRVLNPEFGADYAWLMLPYIKNAQSYYDGELGIEEVGIEVIDAKTIKLTLEQATPYMLDLLSCWTYFPVRKDIVEADENWYRNPETYISNGAFAMKEYNFGESIVLSKNVNYYDNENITLDEIQIDFVEDENTALSAYEAGEVDGVESVPKSEIPRLKLEEEGFYILPKLQHIWINFNIAEAPYDDVRVRKALALAIDREQIVSQILQGGEKPASGLVPLGVQYGGEDFREVGGNYGIPASGDIELAKKLLEEAGYPNGEGFPVIELKDNGKSYIEAVANMWEQNLGLETEIVVREWKIHISELKSLDFSVARGGWTGDYLHPTTFLDIFTPNSGVNYTNWLDDEYVSILKKAQTEQDITKHLDYLHQAEDILMEEMPIAPLYYSTNAMLMNSEVKGWRKSPLGYLYLFRAYK